MEAPGLRGGKKEVSKAVGQQRSALNYHQLTEINLPSYSWQLFVKPRSSIIGVFFVFFIKGTLFYLKVPFYGDILDPTITKNPETALLTILSSISIDISQDNTVIKDHHNTDLSFRSDSSGAVPSSGLVRHHMSVVIDSSQYCQLAAGKLQGKIRTSISVVPNGSLGSREGPPPKHDNITI